MKNYIKIITCTALVSSALMSCEKQEVEDVFLTGKDPDITLTSLQPDYGFVGDEFVINGANLGSASDFMTVYIGENKCRVMSSTNSTVTVQVPVGCTTGNVSVNLFESKPYQQHVTSDLQFKVLGQPSVESVSQLWGFKSDKIHFSGSKLGTCAEDIKITFNGSRMLAGISNWSEEGFDVIVPNDATTGKVEMYVHTQKVNVPFESFLIRAHGAAYDVAPTDVYIGNEFTITGLNMGEYDPELSHVYVGSIACDIVSWTEEKIVCKIPVSSESDLVKGEEYGLQIVSIYETISTEVYITLRENPVINSISAGEGYIGQAVTFAGSNLPTQAAPVKVLFGDIETEITRYNVANGSGNFTVQVPVGLDAGDVTVKVMVGDLQAYESTFKVLDTPTLAAPDFKLVRAGEELTVNGAYLGNDATGVKAFVGDTEAVIKSLTPNAVTIVVPASMPNTIDAPVTLVYENTPCMSEARVSIIASSGDITDMVLTGCHQPYANKEGIDNVNYWMLATPAGDWKYNNAFYVGDGLTELILPLRYDADNDFMGCITFICNRWATAIQKNYLENGKMYQTVNLPAGTYEFTADVMGCGLIAGQVGVAFGAVGADNELPDIDGASYYDNGVYVNTYAPVDDTAYFTNPDNTKSYVMCTDKLVTYGGSDMYKFTLTLETRTTVNVGFTAWATMRGGNGMNFELRQIIVNAK